MSIRNKIALSLSAILAAVSLTACSGGTSTADSSSSSDNSSSAADNSSAAESSNADDSSAAESEASYSPENPVTVKIGLTGNVYEDIWNPIKEKLAPEGINLEYEQFTSFNIPNNALNSGEIDMNAFQHHAYFNNEVATNGYDITAIGDTYIVAMNIYTSKGITIDDALLPQRHSRLQSRTTSPTKAERSSFLRAQVCSPSTPRQALPLRSAISLIIRFPLSSSR